MSESPVSALREELSADPPEGLVAALEGEHLDGLAATVRDAKLRQSAALERAADDALGHLPGLLRKAVERVLR